MTYSGSRNYSALRKRAQELLLSLDEDERWALKQELSSPSRYYGDGGTIHSTNALDIDTDAGGNVIAVWFRCQLLAFRQVRCSEHRTQELIERTWCTAYRRGGFR